MGRESSVDARVYPKTNLLPVVDQRRNAWLATGPPGFNKTTKPVGFLKFWGHQAQTNPKTDWFSYVLGPPVFKKPKNLLVFLSFGASGLQKTKKRAGFLKFWGLQAQKKQKNQLVFLGFGASRL